MSFATRIGLLAGLAGAGLLIYAQKRSEKTGKDIGTVLSNLPEELQETKEQLQHRAKVALEAGKQAAAEKEAEIDRQLEEEVTSSPQPVQDYVV